LLTSQKWYYSKLKNPTGESTCFDATNFWEFKTDGSYKNKSYWTNESGTYEISEDGKTITLNSGSENWTISEISISKNTFSFTILYEAGATNFTLSKTAGTGCDPL